MLFNLSNLNSNLALALGYLNPALNNATLVEFDYQPTLKFLFWVPSFVPGLDYSQCMWLAC